MNSDYSLIMLVVIGWSIMIGFVIAVLINKYPGAAKKAATTVLHPVETYQKAQKVRQDVIAREEQIKRYNQGWDNILTYDPFKPKTGGEPQQ